MERRAPKRSVANPPVNSGSRYWGGNQSLDSPPYQPHYEPSAQYRFGKALGLFFDRKVTHIVAGVTAGTLAGFAIGGIPGKWYMRWGVNLAVGVAGRAVTNTFDGATGAFGTGLVIGSGLSFAWDTVGPLVRGYKAVENFVLDAGTAITNAPAAAAGWTYKQLSTPYLGLPLVGF